MKRDEDSGGMWCLVMFDLPVKTKRQRHAATVFRNMLLDMGYGMVQYSVYVRYTPTQSGNRATVKMIKDNLPANGLVRILQAFRCLVWVSGSGGGGAGRVVWGYGYHVVVHRRPATA